MKTFAALRDILVEILDIDEDDVRPDSYLIRELAAESIDLLELAIAINARFGIEVNDDAIFLRSLRDHIEDAQNRAMEPAEAVAEALPFLPEARIRAIMADLDGGPVLRVRDLLDYIGWQQAKG